MNKTSVLLSLSSSSTKHKFYAVVRGQVPGIYQSWSECSAQVTGWPNALFKSFNTWNEANAYINVHKTEHWNTINNITKRSMKREREIDRSSSRVSDNLITCNKDNINWKVKQREVETMIEPCSHSSLSAASENLLSSSIESFNECCEIENKNYIDATLNKKQRESVEETKKRIDYRESLEKCNILVQEVYVDGACRANGMRNRACAGYGGFYGADHDTRNFALALPACEPQTNNRGELRAVIHAIEQAFIDASVAIPESEGDEPEKVSSTTRHTFQTDKLCNTYEDEQKLSSKQLNTRNYIVDNKNNSELLKKMKNNEDNSLITDNSSNDVATDNVYYLRIFTDSKYVIDGLTKFSKRWVKNNYTLANGKKVQNQDLWKQLITLYEKYNILFCKSNANKLELFKKPFQEKLKNCKGDSIFPLTKGVELVHVRGHTNVHGNIKADSLAVLGAMKNKVTKKVEHIEINDKQEEEQWQITAA